MDLKRAVEAAESIQRATADAGQAAAADAEKLQAGAGDAHQRRSQALGDIYELRKQYEVLCVTKASIGELSGNIYLHGMCLGGWIIEDGFRPLYRCPRRAAAATTRA